MRQLASRSLTPRALRGVVVSIVAAPDCPDDAICDPEPTVHRQVRARLRDRPSGDILVDLTVRGCGTLRLKPLSDPHASESGTWFETTARVSRLPAFLH
jgi:hypothetical protein